MKTHFDFEDYRDGLKRMQDYERAVYEHLMYGKPLPEDPPIEINDNMTDEEREIAEEKILHKEHNPYGIRVNIPGGEQNALVWKSRKNGKVYHMHKTIMYGMTNDEIVDYEYIRGATGFDF